MAAQLSENSHQGFDGIKAALCLGSMEAKSNTASGMPVCLWRNGIGSRSSGKERDAETGLDWFLVRYNSSPQGRFTAPDPFNPIKLKPVQLKKWISNPQRWDKYVYALNNPITMIDPDGMNACGTNDDSTCKVTIIYVSRSKNSKGKYVDRFKDEKGQENFNAKAIVRINGISVGLFLARTIPSSDKFATPANGTFSATLDNHSGQRALRLQPTKNIPIIGDRNPATGKDHAEDILSHASGRISRSQPLGFTGTYPKDGVLHGVSEGCQLIARPAYDLFQRITGMISDNGPPQQNFTVILNTNENEPIEPDE